MLSFPLPANELERLNALYELSILDTAADLEFDRLTQLAAATFQTEIAFVSFIDRSRQWLKSTFGLSGSETAREWSFCTHTIMGDEPMVVLDASTDERFCHNPFVSGRPHIRFYAGAPIRTADGFNVGTLCVVDTKPRTSFSAREQSVLRTLADLATDAVVAHRAGLTKAEEPRTTDRYSIVANATLDGIWDWDLDKGFVYYSPRWEKILGLSNHHSISDIQHWLDRVHPADRAQVELALNQHQNKETPRFRSEHRVRHSDGSWRWVVARGILQCNPDGSPQRIAGSLMDVTKDKTSDPLSGLPNRLLFQERLALKIRQSEASCTWDFAVFFIDIDRFKQVNDRFGHLVGDKILASLAHRLDESIQALRPLSHSIAARFSGDEFVVLLDQIRTAEEAQTIALELRKRMFLPIHIDGERLEIGVSIGIARASANLKTPESFLHNADLAIGRAKVMGGGAVILFDDTLQEDLLIRNELQSCLVNGLLDEQLRVVYQPQVDLRTGQLVGCEALVRWQHPRLGLLSPIDFIGVAEELRLVSLIDSWAMKRACLQLKRWREVDPQLELTMSVNISTQHLAQDGLAHKVAEALKEASLPPRIMCLELTESVVINDLERNIRILKELRDLGVGLHMDDFGSGYSSFKNLYQLPFDTLKIDRSFLAMVPDDLQATKVVEGIIALAHSMSLRVIAEGVESQSQVETLKGFDCDCGQGYYFNRPLNADEFFTAYLAS